MSTLYLILGVVIPYAAVGIFILGVIYRVLKWARSPVPFRIPTTSGQQKSLPWIKTNRVENPTTTVGLISRMAMEVLFFRSLFRNERAVFSQDRRLVFGDNWFLWLGALAFHWSLLIILIRHLRFLTEPVPSFVLFIQDVDGWLQLAVPTIYITDFIIVTALTYLFLRRVVAPQIRYISLLADYFAVLLLLGIAVTGVLMTLIFHVDVAAVKELALGVITFSPSVPEGIGWAFYLHLCLVSTLFAYFPFSKLMHMAGVFLSPTRNMKTNSRERRHVNPWDYPVKVHTYAEWEDEFRDVMKEAGVPVERD